LPIHSLDYDDFLSTWYDFIKSHGGVKALKYNFSNYNMPYLYLLVISTYLPLVKITAIKSISIFFDLVLAGVTYLIVRNRYKKSYLPIIAAVIILFLPTIFINSSLWAQCDSIYTSFLLGGFYLLMQKKPFWAFILFGVAFAFKLQAVFFFPLLFILWMTGEIRLRYFFIIPLVYIVSVFPAYLLGKSFVDIFAVYFIQANNQWPALSFLAPNLFQLLPIPVQQMPFWEHAGILLTLGIVLILSLVVLASKRKITNEIALKLALTFVLIVPFFLPDMHDRYFYIADVLSLSYAFYSPKHFYVPIIVQFCSLESYTGFLMQNMAIAAPILAILMLGVTTMVVWDLVKTLWTIPQQSLVALPTNPKIRALVHINTGSL